MSNQALNLALALAAFGGLFYLAEPYLTGEKAKARQEAAQQHSETPRSAPQLSVVQPMQSQESSSAISLRKAPDGQFWAEGQVNRGHVKFLVDTGASVVALTREDARKAGLDMNRLRFDRPVKTANGQTMGAYVRLDSVSIGTLTLRNVDALVIPEGLSVSLLGMSYLGQLQKVEATRDSMILRL